MINNPDLIPDSLTPGFALHRSRLNSLGPHKVLADPFSQTQDIVEGQRLAFMNETLSLKTRLQAPIDIKKFKPKIRTVRPTSLFARQIPRKRRVHTLPPIPESYSIHTRRLKKFQVLDEIVSRCRDSSPVQDVRRTISHEQRLLKKYSKRMDWALRTLNQVGDL